MPQHINLSAILFDSATQIRAAINNDTVAEYAERMKAGDEFPPAIVFAEPRIDSYLIGDGWHRLLAAQRAGAMTFPCEVMRGGRAEAIRFALGANVTHGLRRTAADKRKAVEVALREFPDMSDRAIADACGVHHDMVGAARKRQVADSATRQNLPTTRKGADGRRYPAHPPRSSDSAPGAATPPPAGPPAGKSRRATESTPSPEDQSAPPAAPAHPAAAAGAPPAPVAPADAASPAKYSFPQRRDAIVAFIERQLAEAPAEYLAAVKQVFRDAVAAKCSGEKPTVGAPQWGDRKVIPPLPAWVTAYSASIGYPMDGQKWCDGYEQKKWMVGRTRMSDWQAAVRNWKTNGWGLGTVTLSNRRSDEPRDYTKI